LKSVRTRLVLLNIGLLALILVGLAAALHFRIRANLFAAVDDDLRSSVVSVKTGADVKDADFGEREFGTLPSGDKRAVRQEIMQPTHTAPHGQTNDSFLVELLRSNRGSVRFEATASIPHLIPVPLPPDHLAEAHVEDLAGYRLAEVSTADRFHDYWSSKTRMRSLSKPVLQDGKIVAVIQAIRPLTPVDSQIADLDRGLVMLVPLGVLVAAIAGAIFVGSAMRPIRKLVESARTLDPQLSSARLPVDGKDEFAQLATEFNSAFDRTTKAFDQQQAALKQLERFTGDAGHELRTPLAAVKGASGYLLHMTELPESSRNSVHLIDRSADRMARLIDDLLLLARQDGGEARYRCEDVDLGATLEEVLVDIPVPQNLVVAHDSDLNLLVRTDPSALQRILTNLITNAVAYARSEVTVEATKQDTRVLVSIRDDGEGIAPEHLSKLGERFYRPDDSRQRLGGGTGLGLAIVKSLCASLDIQLQIESKVGSGTCVSLSIKAMD